MSAAKVRICQICGATLAPHDDFCPVCAFRGALQTDDAATELSEPLVPAGPDLDTMKS